MEIMVGHCILKCFEDGKILRRTKTSEWREIPNRINHIKGYNVIMIEKKQYMRSHLIAHAFLEFDLNNKEYIVCHLDQNKINASKDNLEVRSKKSKR